MSGDGFQGWDGEEIAQEPATEHREPLEDPWAGREIRDLAGVAAFFCLDPDATIEKISSAAYDQTECGAFVENIRPQDYGENGPGIAVGSIVEGSEVQARTHLLHFPFNHADLSSALAQIEEEARELWHIANCHTDNCERENGGECLGCKDCECDLGGDGEDPGDHPGFDAMFMTF